MIGRLSDAAIGASVAPTLREVHADPAAPWSRQLVAQLVAVVEYARDRGDDPSLRRTADLAAALDALTGNELVPDAGSPYERAGAALAAAVAAPGPAAEAVQETLRPLLVAELDGELAETMAMMDGFRGRLRGR